MSGCQISKPQEEIKNKDDDKNKWNKQSRCDHKIQNTFQNKPLINSNKIINIKIRIMKRPLKHT